MGVAGRPLFSFAELLDMLDVEGAGEMSSPLPTASEAASLTTSELRGVAPCVEVHGPCRFRSGLAHLYSPPHTELVVSPAHVMLSFTRFADDDTWKNILDYVTSYFADTLTATARSDDAHGYQEYAGQGLIATVGYSRPSARVGSRDLVIELALRRDESGIAAIRSLLGIATDTTIAPPDDGNWRDLATQWPVHLECSRLRETVRFRVSAPHVDGQVSTATLCEEWAWRWLDLTSGTRTGQHDHQQLVWELPDGRASIVRGGSAGRRDVHELHVPVAWLTEPRIDQG
jgi:hypothetical protein